MILRISILLSILTIFSCSRNANSFVVEGRITNVKKQKVILHEITMENLIPIDSVEVSSIGHFKLKGKSDTARYFVITPKNNSSILLIIKNGERISLEINTDSLYDYKISGSAESELLAAMYKKIWQSRKKVDSLGNENLKIRDLPTYYTLKQSLDSTYWSIFNDTRNFLTEMITTHPNSLASLMALDQQIAPRTYILDMEKDFHLFNMVDSSLQAMYKNYPPVKLMHEKFGQFKDQRNYKMRMNQLIGVGIKAPNIILPDQNGNQQEMLSNNKLILLSFWASWSEVSVKEQSTLKKIHEQYSDKGLSIYQVSLDKKKNAWIKSIEDLRLQWTNVSDFKMWNSPVVNLYNVNKVPSYFLIDKNNTIVSVENDLELISQEIKKQLKRK